MDSDVDLSETGVMSSSQLDLDSDPAQADLPSPRPSSRSMRPERWNTITDPTRVEVEVERAKLLAEHERSERERRLNPVTPSASHLRRMALAGYRVTLTREALHPRSNRAAIMRAERGNDLATLSAKARRAQFAKTAEWHQLAESAREQASKRAVAMEASLSVMIAELDSALGAIQSVTREDSGRCEASTQTEDELRGVESNGGGVDTNGGGVESNEGRVYSNGGGGESNQCRVEDAECEVGDADCGVGDAECGVEREKCGVKEKKCGPAESKYGVKWSEVDIEGKRSDSAGNGDETSMKSEGSLSGKLVYTRYFLLECSKSDESKMKPALLPDMEDVKKMKVSLFDADSYLLASKPRRHPPQHNAPVAMFGGVEKYHQHPRPLSCPSEEFLMNLAANPPHLPPPPPHHSYLCLNPPQMSQANLVYLPNPPPSNAFYKP